jgi:hypothetical protein
MGSILAVLFAWVAQLQMLPMGIELRQQAAQTATMITTAQQETTILAAAAPYIQQNLTTIEASATATTPYTISIAQLAAANVGPNGLPASFSATNPYGQTWQVQVLQPTAGNLQALVVGINGAGATKLTDMQAAGIAGYAGQPGGFVPQNDSGIYPTGRVYGNKAGWGFATTGYQNLTGGQPAALLVMNNGQQQNLYLYRVAVPGQPQLTTMQTTLNMGNNAITAANGIATSGGSNAQSVQVGSSYYYGDGLNSAIRQNGGLYIQNQAGTAAADIASVGDGCCNALDGQSPGRRLGPGERQPDRKRAAHFRRIYRRERRGHRRRGLSWPAIHRDWIRRCPVMRKRRVDKRCCVQSEGLHDCQREQRHDRAV